MVTLDTKFTRNNIRRIAMLLDTREVPQGYTLISDGQPAGQPVWDDKVAKAKHSDTTNQVNHQLGIEQVDGTLKYYDGSEYVQIPLPVMPVMLKFDDSKSVNGAQIAFTITQTKFNDINTVLFNSSITVGSSSVPPETQIYSSSELKALDFNDINIMIIPFNAKNETGSIYFTLNRNGLINHGELLPGTQFNLTISTLLKIK